ncbi:phosphodiester glycosidase family protein [Gaiella sp.]|uniref:phosphodiester glycosidase family protein n=1 Tax=Gaiella sp. TaxID=2663207 RepID=UPI0032658022
MGRLLLTAVAALLLVAPAAAQPRELWPGVSFETAVQFTSNGPVALNVLIGPRPGGTTTLAPALSNETLTGTETLTAIQRRVAGSVTSAGVNGDFFNFKTGVPSGVLMREGQVASPPFGERSSAGIMTDGTLDVRRISFFGTWQGAGAKRTLNTFNEAPPPNGTALYTQAWGPTTPPLPGATALILFPLPAPVPNADLVAPVVEVRTGGDPVPIPLGGAVLVGVGSVAAALAVEGPVGQEITSRLIFKPEWPGVVAAIGGGPQIVRNGAAIFRAGETFTPFQLGTRAPRTGLGQLADGRIILVAVDGRQPGYSVGMTNFELAQAMVRLGAVTAMAFDGGGSTTMAFNGTLLSKLVGAERPISTALLFEYTGVFVQPTIAVVSPDGDGIADRQSLRYKLVRPATITITLTAPDGVVALAETRERQPGSFAIPFPPVAAPPVALGGTATPPVNGRWKLQVAAVDDLGQPSAMTQTFTVNTTVGFLVTAPRKLFLPPGGRDLGITWKQSRPARVVVTVETPAGEVVRTLARRVYPASTPALVWNGLDRTKKAVKGGRYVVRVTAKNALGTIELSKPVRVQRIVGPR